MAWQVATGYGQRALIETTMGRYKALIGPRLRARGFAAQQTEAAIGVAALNRMLAAGRPKSFVAGASSHDEPGLGSSGTLPGERTKAESQATQRRADANCYQMIDRGPLRPSPPAGDLPERGRISHGGTRTTRSSPAALDRLWIDRRASSSR
jgi:hypothetical protein